MQSFRVTGRESDYDSSWTRTSIRMMTDLEFPKIRGTVFGGSL